MTAASPSEHCLGSRGYVSSLRNITVMIATTTLIPQSSPHESCTTGTLRLTKCPRPPNYFYSQY